MKLSSRTIFLTVIAIVLSSRASWALDDTYTYFGDGADHCSAYIRAAERDRKAAVEPAYYIDRNYIGFMSFTSGFLSGANVMAGVVGANAQVGAHTDVSGRMLWLENWCRAHPLEDFESAVIALRSYLFKNPR